MMMSDSGDQIRKVSQQTSDQWPLPLRAPWPSQIPWWVMVGGGVLGWGVGYTPHLFIAMAAMCLLLGFLNRGAADS